MAWDSARPVAYRRLVKEWLIYAAIMTVLFLLLMRNEANEWSLLVGLVASLPLYIGFSYVLAKFGYQRKTLAEMRTPRAGADRSTPTAATPARQRPAPTRRTAAGAARPAQRSQPRKRR